MAKFKNRYQKLSKYVTGTAQYQHTGAFREDIALGFACVAYRLVSGAVKIYGSRAESHV